MRIALAVAVATLWAASPAAAAPVVGGGSFHDAPVLKPGSYRDTLLPQEVLYYAVDLNAGQAIDLDVTIDHDDPERLTHGYGVNVWDPLRAPVDTQDQEEPGQAATRIHVTSPQASTPQREIEDASWYRQYRGPGRYYISIVDPGGFRGNVVEADVAFDLNIVGDPSEQPPATPTPTPTPTATPKPEKDDDGGGSFATAILAGGGGLIAGALIGFAAVLATRREKDE